MQWFFHVYGSHLLSIQCIYKIHDSYYLSNLDFLNEIQNNSMQLKECPVKIVDDFNDLEEYEFDFSTLTLCYMKHSKTIACKMQCTRHAFVITKLISLSSCIVSNQCMHHIAVFILKEFNHVLQTSKQLDTKIISYSCKVNPGSTCEQKQIINDISNINCFTFDFNHHICVEVKNKRQKVDIPIKRTKDDLEKLLLQEDLSVHPSDLVLTKNDVITINELDDLYEKFLRLCKKKIPSSVYTNLSCCFCWKSCLYLKKCHDCKAFSVCKSCSQDLCTNKEDIHCIQCIYEDQEQIANHLISKR